MPRRLKILLLISIVFFALTLFGFLFASNATFASKRLEAKNNQGEHNGYAHLSHDYNAGMLLTLSFAALSGLQLWTVWEICRLSRLSARS